MAGPLKKKVKKGGAKKARAKPSVKGMFLEEERKRLKVDEGESEMVVPGEIALPSERAGENVERGESMGETRWDIFAAYFFMPVGSVILWLLNKEKRTVFHCKQSGVLGILTWILTFALVGWIVWLYGLYVGWKAANGEDVDVPLLTKELK